jgi:hypothetical protein
LRSIALSPGAAAAPSATLSGHDIALGPAAPNHDRFTFTEEIIIHAGEELVLLA